VINCQYVLGLHYENGEGVNKDMDEAVKWYLEAAKNGQRDAIDALKRLGAE
jgi:TPR repeat protein